MPIFDACMLRGVALNALAPAGIPINATLLPALPGFELTTGIEMEFSEETDFYCRGSTTTKPVCQLYGTARVRYCRNRACGHVLTHRPSVA